MHISHKDLHLVPQPIHRSPASQQKGRDRLDSGNGGVAKAVKEEEPEPDDEETLLMKEMMGFNKFDTTKVCALINNKLLSSSPPHL